jgi:hypothetical protein
MGSGTQLERLAEDRCWSIFLSWESRDEGWIFRNFLSALIA